MEHKSLLVPSRFPYFAFSGIRAATIGKVATQLIPIPVYRKRVLPAELAFYWSQRVVMLTKCLHDRVQNLLVFQKATPSSLLDPLLCCTEVEGRGE